MVGDKKIPDLQVVLFYFIYRELAIAALQPVKIHCTCLSTKQ